MVNDDETGSISATLFAELVNSVNNNEAYTFHYLRISKYFSQRLLKSTHQTTIETVDNHNYEQPIHSKSINHLENVSMETVNTNSFKTVYKCIVCKDGVIFDEHLIECLNCGNMFSSKKCIKFTTIKFSVRTGDGTSMQLSSKNTIIEKCFGKCFGVSVEQKRSLVAETTA